MPRMHCASMAARFTLRKALPTRRAHLWAGRQDRAISTGAAQSFVDWNTDAWGFQRDTDPIYKSIPFYIATGGEGGAYGLFLDNTLAQLVRFRPSRRRHDRDRRRRRADRLLRHRRADRSRRRAPLYRPDRQGADAAALVARFPAVALQLHERRPRCARSRSRLRCDRIPADVIWLDIDFQDRNRPFTTNPKTFPDLKGLARRRRRARASSWSRSPTFTSPTRRTRATRPTTAALAGDHFLKNPDGSLYVAPVWPGPSVFPDFTRAASRDWWGRLYKDFVDDGIAGFWNDMNEPAIFETPTKTMPLDTVHRIESDDFAPRAATHAEVHNVYGMENSRATYEGLLKLRPERAAVRDDARDLRRRPALCGRPGPATTARPGII